MGPDLRTLVETNAADASRMRGWLAPGSPAIEQPFPQRFRLNAWHFGPDLVPAKRLGEAAPVVARSQL